MPSRMRVIDNELILDNACKNCEDRTTDLQVIQCNASNVHGYQFVDAYINVLRKSTRLLFSLVLLDAHISFFYLLSPTLYGSL